MLQKIRINVTNSLLPLITRIRQKHALPDRASRWVLGLSALAVTGSATVFAAGAARHIPSALLERENRLLRDELQRLETRLAGFDAGLSTLAEKSERFRTLAGMSGIDEEVLQVGVGGPGLESVGEDELWTLDPKPRKPPTRSATIWRLWSGRPP